MIFQTTYIIVFVAIVSFYGFLDNVSIHANCYSMDSKYASRGVLASFIVIIEINKELTLL